MSEKPNGQTDPYMPASGAIPNVDVKLVKKPGGVAFGGPSGGFGGGGSSQVGAAASDPIPAHPVPGLSDHLKKK
jgi:hypothetical protein